MEIPYDQLKSETLKALIEEFVTRDGTDYGLQEATFSSKVADVYRLLREKKIKIVFDAETESCDIREVVKR